jgi:AAA family ATP:ADP antiporter
MKGAKEKNALEKFLSIFTEVRSGEGFSAVLLFLNIFLIFTSYYIMKPVREALILSGGLFGLSGAVIKQFTSTSMVIVLMGAVPLYGFLASKFPRRRLINVVTVFFASCIVLFYFLALIKIPLGIIFFIWIGIFNLMIPAQFWAFSNDLYTPESGKRIFVIIAFGASLGSVLGAIIAGLLIKPLGVYQVLLGAGAILLLSLVLTNLVDTREKVESKKDHSSKGNKVDEPLSKEGAFRLVYKTKYLLLMALLIMVLNWVNTTGEYILGQAVENNAKKEAQKLVFFQNRNQLSNISQTIDGLTATAPINSSSLQQDENISDKIREFTENYIGDFYAKFYAGVNIISLLFQLFLVSRILKYLGIRIALLILPVIALSGYFIIAFVPILSFIRIAKTAENSVDYSLQNTVRQVLFLPTTREEKYKAKQAIDTLFWRLGDVFSFIVVAIGTYLALSIMHFAIINIVLVSIWLIIAILIGIENKRITHREQIEENK